MRYDTAIFPADPAYLITSGILEPEVGSPDILPLDFSFNPALDFKDYFLKCVYPVLGKDFSRKVYAIAARRKRKFYIIKPLRVFPDIDKRTQEIKKDKIENKLTWRLIGRAFGQM